MNVKYGKIGDFAKRVKVGFVGTCEKYYTEDKRYPMIRTTNLTETGIDYSDIKYVTEEFYDRNKKSQLHDGDVLIARFGTSGTACVYHGGDAQCLNAIIVEPDVENTIPEYLAIVINSRSVRDQVNKRIVGSTQAILNTKVLSDIDIVLPSLEEQKKIVDIFQSLHHICLQRTEELKSLDELVKARFVELFGNPVSNPKRWVKRPLIDVCTKLNDGTHFSPESFDTGDYKYVTAKNIKISGFDFSNISYVSEEVHRSIYERCNPEYGDVLYIKDGATTGIAMVNSLHEEFTLLSSVALLKQNRDIMNGEFLCSVLNNDEMYLDIRNNMGGAAITRLTIAKLNGIQIIVPPLELQEKYAEFVKQIDKSKVTVQKSLDETRKLFDSLMQEYFG